MLDLLLAVPLTALLGFGAQAPLQLAGTGAVAGPTGYEQPAPLLEAQADGTYSLTSLRLVSKVVLLVKENYVDQIRVHPREMLIAAMNAVERDVAEVLAHESVDQSEMVVQVGAVDRTFALAEVGSLWEMTFKLREIFQFLDRELPADIDRHQIEYAAINGMLSTLDPHSVLLVPELYEEMKMSTRGEFGGLGIVIAIRDGKLTVVSPIEGTPAHQAGIRRLDHIARIGDESTVNMALDEAVKKLRGPPGTQVTIWVLREQWSEPRKFVLTRANIKIESVSAAELLPGDIGYVRVKNFQADTTQELEKQIGRLESRAEGGLRGLIMDLRDNPGGLLEQAISVSDVFLEAGVIVSTVGVGKPKVESAHWANSKTNLPLVVLVNGGSASASEIVAGAIKNNDRGIVVGERTFGKGSVQVLYDFQSDGSALKLTVAQYLTPGDISIQNTGIVPDIDLEEATIGKDYVDLFRDAEAVREKSLQKHLDDQRVREQKPDYQLRYLGERAVEEDADAAAVREAQKQFKNDFQIDLARRLIAEHPAKTRHGLLVGARGLVADITAEQEQKITKALAEIGVDWSLGLNAPGAQAAVQVLSPTTTVAGSDLAIELEVKNTGSAPLYRLRGTTESKNYVLADREYMFGLLKPGESRRWAVHLKTPKDSLARTDEMTVKFDEQFGHAPAPQPVKIKVQALPRPRFEFSALIDDSGGNGDGLLDSGETVDLVLAVRNVGEGVAESPIAVLKNQSGEALFVTTGRERMEKMPPGSSRVARMRFEVRPTSLSQVELLTTVGDLDLGASTVEKLRLTVVAGGQRSQPASGFASASAGVPLLAAAAADAAVIGRLAAGESAPAVSRNGAYYRLKLGDGLFGFVPVAGVQLVNVSKPPKNTALPALGYSIRPPVVNVVNALVGGETDQDSIALSGTVESTLPVRDLFIFSNSGKVYYTAWRGPTGYRTPFAATVPLEEGPNVITVVGRVDEELNGRASIVINRVKTGIGVAQPTPETR